MDFIVFALILLTVIQGFLTMRKYKKINHIGELTQVNELMGYIDRKELSLTDDFGRNAFMIASSSYFYTKKGEFGFEDVVKNGISSGVDIDTKNILDGKTALMYALNNKENNHTANLLIDAGANVNLIDATGRLPLFDSIKNNHCYKEVVSRTSDMDHQDNFGVTALMIAAYRMDFDIINDLLNRNVNTRLTTSSGLTAYEIAQKYMHQHIRVLIETPQDAEYGKNSTIVTSDDVLKAQKYNHRVRETVRKLACYTTGDEYTEKPFKRPLLNTSKAN